MFEYFLCACAGQMEKKGFAIAVCLTHGVLRNKRGVVWTDLVYGLSCFATDFAERRDAKFKGEFVAKYVPESTVSVETGRRKAGAEKSLLIPSSTRSVCL